MKQIPDLYLVQNHDVVAVYVTGLDILRNEGALSKPGVPFIAYVGNEDNLKNYVENTLKIKGGRSNPELSDSLTPYLNVINDKTGIYYLSKDEFSKMLNLTGRIAGLIDLNAKLNGILAISNHNKERGWTSLLLEKMQRVEHCDVRSVNNALKSKGFKRKAASYDVPFVLGFKYDGDPKRRIRNHVDYTHLVNTVMPAVKKKRDGLFSKLF